MAKPAYKSKTLTGNSVAIVVIWILWQFGVVIPAEVAVSIVAIGNMAVRFITREPLGK
ncbi:MAG: hypothetical protein ABIJ57_10950 [Pseudomonadota bacterium]